MDGEVCWEGSTSEPRTFLAHHLVAYASDHEMLYPGDVLGTGTIGTSCSMDTKRWIEVGQRARFEVEGLGSSTMRSPPRPRWWTMSEPG